MTARQASKIDQHCLRRTEIEAITVSLQCAQQSELVSELTVSRILSACERLDLPQVKAVRAIVDDLANAPAHGLMPIWDEEPPLVSELRGDMLDRRESIRGGRRAGDIHRLVYDNPDLQDLCSHEASQIIQHGGMTTPQRDCSVLRTMILELV